MRFAAWTKAAKFRQLKVAERTQQAPDSSRSRSRNRWQSCATSPGRQNRLTRKRRLSPSDSKNRSRRRETPTARRRKKTTPSQQSVRISGAFSVFLSLPLIALSISGNAKNSKGSSVSLPTNFFTSMIRLRGCCVEFSLSIQQSMRLSDPCCDIKIGHLC